MERQPKVRRRMMIFVATIFIIACCLAVYFVVRVHPGEPAPGGGSAVSTQNP